MKKLSLAIAIVIAIGLAAMGNCVSAQSVEATDGSGTRAAVSTEVPLKQYFLVLLRKGPHRDQDAAASAKIQAAHLDHIDASGQSGKLVMAGPFADDGDLRGVLIYDVPTIEEARTSCNDDPAVKAGRLICDIHPWMGQPGTALK